LKKYLEQKDDLHAGRKPRPALESLTVKDLINEFLNHKKGRVQTGELTRRMFDDYKAACDLLIEQFGKSRLVDDLGPDDFSEVRNKLAGKWGPHRLAGTIQRIRSVFKFAFDEKLIGRPVSFGQSFKGPSKRTFRLERAAQGPKLFTQKEILELLAEAGTHLRAMILLGINCGYGNSDCGTLPLSAVNLETGWIDYPRPKTGIPRRCALWPETVDALKQSLAKRPEPKDSKDSGLVFITKYGMSWAKDTSTNPVSQETAKLLRSLKINGRKGLGFYTLRHVFRTIADESKDQVAVDFIMGHADDSMAGHYREKISDARLKAVAEHVRGWLFGTGT
jgi:integrase